MAQPLAFAVNQLRDIHEADRRAPSEEAAFAEVRAVLRKHGLAGKYGLTLLHKHFDLSDDEMMVEYTDLENRTLTSKPAKVGTIPQGNLMEVTWALEGETDTVASVCVWRCYYNSQSTPPHVGQHAAG